MHDETRQIVKEVLSGKRTGVLVVATVERGETSAKINGGLLITGLTVPEAAAVVMDVFSENSRKIKPQKK